MKTVILAAFASTFAATTFAGVASAQTRDCSGFSERANFYGSIGLTSSQDFWNSVATSCTDSNWADEDRSTVRSNIRTLAETESYERPDRDAVRAAAEANDVELTGRGQRRGGQGGGRGPRGGGRNGGGN